MHSIYRSVYNLIRTIPQGKVSTYSAIAKQLGIKSPRLVGKILHNNPDPSLYPCHRIVFADGGLASSYAFGGLESQKDRLMDEGVVFKKNGKVDLEQSIYCF
jgi:methylated-DNA-protein-cysteine methyltransferase-like protein